MDSFFVASDDGDTEAVREWMKSLLAKGPELGIVTLCEDGSLVYDGERFTKYGIVLCKVVDTMGAGDSYIAGFLKGLLEGREILECMAMGAANASCTLEYNGAGK